MSLIDVTKALATENQCLDYLERMRLPIGVCCIACDSAKVSKIVREKAGKDQHKRIY